MYILRHNLFIEKSLATINSKTMAPKEKKPSADMKKIINFYKIGLSMEKQITGK